MTFLYCIIIRLYIHSFILLHFTSRKSRHRQFFDICINPINKHFALFYRTENKYFFRTYYSSTMRPNNSHRMAFTYDVVTCDWIYAPDLGWSGSDCLIYCSHYYYYIPCVFIYLFAAFKRIIMKYEHIEFKY